MASGFLVCASCGAENEIQEHHLIPRVHGGLSGPTVYLCAACHGAVHGRVFRTDHAALIRVGLAAAKAEGRIPGRRSYAESVPETVALAKAMHADGLSYRAIFAALAEQGHVTGHGKPHVASAVQKMVTA